MVDELVRIHLRGPELLLVGVLCPATARRARDIHHCLPTSAGLLAEAMSAGYGVAGLLGGQARINLQLNCDGPLRGLFVDADAEGFGRGYVKNPAVNFLSDDGSAELAAALGGSGVLSVLRELKAGEFYRGAVGLEAFDLARDLERYYRESEQIETLVRLHVAGDAEEPLGRVTSLFVQRLPESDRDALARLRHSLDLDQLLANLRPGARALELVRPIQEVFPDSELEMLARVPLEYRCGCSAEKVVRAVLAMGRAEIEDMLQTDGKAVATCAFCSTVYELNSEQLEKLLEVSAEEEAEAEDEADLEKN